MTSRRISRFFFITIPVLLCIGLIPAAHADIYKCTDEHGNVAYLQTPCPVEKVEEASAVEVERDEYVPESTPAPQSTEAKNPSSRQPDESLGECKKRYRDQIDEIDAEMRKGFSAEQGATYKARLLALTRELRACK